jgi:hypothetical protein
MVAMRVFGARDIEHSEAAALQDLLTHPTPVAP